MEKRVLLTELVDRGTHLRKEITPTATITDNGKYPAGTFWDANKTLNEIVAGATDAQDTLKEVEDKLNKEIEDARKAEQDIKDQIDDILGIDAQDIADLKQVVEDLDPETGILSVIDGKADKSEMSISTSGDQTTITLKSGTQATVLNAHQDISGKANTSDLTAHTTNTSVHVTQSLLDRISRLEANGHDYVEIGGLKWATVNIGANSITDYGFKFQWGDTQGYTHDQVGDGDGKKYFGAEDYKYYDGSNMTKYNNTDGQMTLSISDDAAQVNWGGGWRMPTQAEFAALINATTLTWIADYQGSGVAGITLTDKTDNSKVLFFPAAGYCQNGNVGNVGGGGSFWSSSRYNDSASFAYIASFSSSGINYTTYGGRINGYSVRGVIG